MNMTSEIKVGNEVLEVIGRNDYLQSLKCKTSRGTIINIFPKREVMVYKGYRGQFRSLPVNL